MASRLLSHIPVLRPCAGTMKGQYFSFDVIIALVLFIFTFIFILSYWSTITSVMQSQYSSSQDTAQKIGGSLLTPGIPADWDLDGGYSPADEEIGLAISDSNPILSFDKWHTLSTVSVDNSKFKEYLKSNGWEVCLNLTVPDSVSSAGYIGNCSIPVSAHTGIYSRVCSINISSGASLDNRIYPAILRVIVWRDTNTSTIR